MSQQTLRKWARGLLGAAINSAVGAISLVVVDPVDFSPFDGGLSKLLQVSLALGLVGAGLYVKTHPLPVDE